MNSISVMKKVRDPRLISELLSTHWIISGISWEWTVAADSIVVCIPTGNFHQPYFNPRPHECNRLRKRKQYADGDAKNDANMRGLYGSQMEGPKQRQSDVVHQEEGVPCISSKTSTTVQQGDEDVSWRTPTSVTKSVDFLSWYLTLGHQ